MSDPVLFSIPELSDEGKTTNTAMLRDPHFDLNWSRKTAQLSEQFTPDQLCAVLIRASENFRRDRIQNMAGWIVTVLQAPEPDMLVLWDEDKEHWIYKKHILKQEPNTPVSEEAPPVPVAPPLPGVNGSKPPVPTTDDADTSRLAKELWTQTLSELALSMPAATFENWIAHSTGLSYADGKIVIGVADAYARDWLEQRLKTVISRSLSRQVHRVVEVVFQVKR